MAREALIAKNSKKVNRALQTGLDAQASGLARIFLELIIVRVRETTLLLSKENIKLRMETRICVIVLNKIKEKKHFYI